MGAGMCCSMVTALWRSGGEPSQTILSSSTSILHLNRGPAIVVPSNSSILIQATNITLSMRREVVILQMLSEGELDFAGVHFWGRPGARSMM